MKKGRGVEKIDEEDCCGSTKKGKTKKKINTDNISQEISFLSCPPVYNIELSSFQNCIHQIPPLLFKY